MATVDFMAMPTDVVSTSHGIKQEDPPLKGPQMHRIRTVRLQQGASLRSVARQSGVDVRQLRLQEEESTDVRLSDLHKWQKALNVPLSELLSEPDSSLSRPVMERARMVRLMKTAAAIRDRTQAVSVKRMAEMLVSQLVEIMPELAEVSPWHEYGQRRSLQEYGRIVERPVSEDFFRSASHD
ncbi:MAG: helix-turn-helix transcriptional regulator [Planctomycetes bacterium]|nr:helix-turn-helix transcriptional regulator [Planctomycetota bacterium]